MATVMLAEDTRLGRSVALKRVHAGGDVQGATRLKREALVGASLSHPNLVSVYDVQSESDGDLTIVMEYVEGETLRDRIQSRGSIPPEASIRVLEGVAAALDAIHERGIIHRDVKPANILLGADGSVKLADLGVAAVADRTRITSADAVVGSFSYMAPEQLEPGTSNPGMDVYALAAVAFEMLSGEKARLETNPVALAHAIANQPPPDLRDRWMKAPPAAAKVLQRAMASDPSERPASAGQLVSELRDALGLGTAGDTGAAVQRQRDGAPPRHRDGAALVPIAPVVPDPAPPRRSATRPEPSRPRPSRARPAAGPSGVIKPASARRPSRLVPALLLLALLVIAGVAIAALSSGRGTRHRGTTAAATSHRKQTGASARSRTTAASSSATTAAGSGANPAASSSTAQSSTAPSGTGASSSATGAGAPAPATTGGTGPAAAVQTFYEDAARHDYSAAWALADSRLRSQLGGYSSFQNQMSSVRSITFHRAQTLTGSTASAATVAVSTTSVQTSRTQQCSGTARTVRSGGQWLLDGISISC